MSSDGPEQIVRMANDIGSFFRAEPDRKVALDGISNHINKFWTRRMRQRCQSQTAPVTSNAMKGAPRKVCVMPR